MDHFSSALKQPQYSSVPILTSLISASLESLQLESNDRRRIPLTLSSVPPIIMTSSSTTTTIVLLLATEDYLDLFSNFLCSLQTIPRKRDLATSYKFLVVTNSWAVASLAAEHQISFLPIPFNRTSFSGADFGSLRYQELMLLRTESVLELASSGFKIAIADIDTGGVTFYLVP